MAEFYRRRLAFAGYEWLVKGTDTPEGPGPNYFSHGEDQVWVDDEGALHLRISRGQGMWRCAEVVTAESFGHGTYVFSVASGAEHINEQAVLGLFTWDPQPGYHNREIDIEIARWGDADNQNCQFVVQPGDRAGNIVRFGVPSSPEGSTHSFEWRRESIAFESVLGPARAPDYAEAVLRSWLHTGKDIPPPGGENARINLWLFRGQPPTDGLDIEVVISGFEFVP